LPTSGFANRHRLDGMDWSGITFFQTLLCFFPHKTVLKWVLLNVFTRSEFKIIIIKKVLCKFLYLYVPNI